MRKDNNRRPGSRGEGRMDSKNTGGKFRPSKDFFEKRGDKKTEFSSESRIDKKEYKKVKGFDKEKRFDKGKGFDKPSYGEKSRYSKDDRNKGPQKPYGFRSDEKRPEGEFKKVYKGRGKDEKPVHEWVPADKYSKDTRHPKKNFKKPFAKPNNEERPEYNFEKLEQIHKKKNKSVEIRLNKYISNSGICSRREADGLIQQGNITVNGQVVKEMGYKVKLGDKVQYKGKMINPEKPVYLLLNKPKDFITTTEDPMERKTVMNLIANACEERMFPVGRLDRNTTGLLLFTNDGELAAKLSHPSNNIKKIYQVTLDKPLTQNDEKAILDGLQLEDGLAQVDDMQVLSKDRTILGLEIHLGRNRIVRRIFAQLGYEVVALDRVMYAGLDKKDLPRGNYRFLTEKEVIRLKFFL